GRIRGRRLNMRGSTIRARSALIRISCLAIAALASHALAGKKDDAEKRPFQILKPSVELTAAEGYQEVREIGGVRIELASVPFVVKPMYFVSVQQRKSAWEEWTGLRVGQGAPVWIGVLPFYEVARMS